MTNPDKKNHLTRREETFVAEYIKTLNGAQSAITAKFSDKPGSAKVKACQLLKKPIVKAAIEKARGEIQQRTKVDTDFIITSLKEVAQRCMQAIPVLDHEGEHTGEYRFDSAGANRALELIGKHLGMFEGKNEDPGVKAVETMGQIVKDAFNALNARQD